MIIGAEISTSAVTIFNQTVLRPKTVDPSDWIDFWREVALVAEEENFGKTRKAFICDECQSEVF